MSPRIVIVGAGVSGLATASFLLEAAPDAEVTVLEATDRAGGNVRTIQAGGTSVEAGPDAIVTGRPEVTRLATRLGLDAELMAPRAEAGRVLVARGSKLVPMPDGLVLGVPSGMRALATTPLLSMRGKLRAAMDLLLPQGDDEPRSLGHLVERRLGREVKDHLVEPLIGGVLAADIDRLDPSAGGPALAGARGSLIRAMAKAKRPAGNPLRAPRSGMHALVDALVDDVGASRIRLGTSVADVRREGQRGYVVELASGERLSSDHLVLAVPPHAASRLIAGLDPELATSLDELRAVSTATVVLVFPEGTALPPSSGLLVPRIEGRALLAATFVNTKWSRASETGEVVVRAYLGGARSPELVDAGDDDALVRRALDDLRVYLSLPDPVGARVTRFDRATPQPELGHHARVARVRARAAMVPGLSLVSAAYEGPGIAGCVAQAAAVAGRVFPRTGAEVAS